MKIQRIGMFTAPLLLALGTLTTTTTDAMYAMLREDYEELREESR